MIPHKRPGTPSNAQETASLRSLVMHTIMRSFVTFFCFSSFLNRYMITPNIRVTQISLAASCTLYISLSFPPYNTAWQKTWALTLSVKTA